MGVWGLVLGGVVGVGVGSLIILLDLINRLCIVVKTKNGKNSWLLIVWKKVVVSPMRKMTYYHNLSPSRPLVRKDGENLILLAKRLSLYQPHQHHHHHPL